MQGYNVTSKKVGSKGRAQCPRASKGQLDAAVAAAKAAFPAWAATPIEERRKLVIKMADAIEANAGELARILTSEQGKPLADATGEVMGVPGDVVERGLGAKR
jgi:acyl-CoA reductase-like NAD-dependent aldehyde dehydrogenase